MAQKRKINIITQTMRITKNEDDTKNEDNLKIKSTAILPKK